MASRATVIIPTFGNAKFAFWSIKSVQNQTVSDIEICIICDGSPASMVSFFKNIAKKDPRIKVFTFQKSPRTGEPYRDIVIKQATGKNIFYCCHDDLWLPHHIQELELSLIKYSFTISFSIAPKLQKKIKDENELFRCISSIDFRKREIISKMHWGAYLSGLTSGAHTRESYYQLEQGWATTPRRYIPTDVYMWYKFLLSNRKGYKPTRKVTSLKFPQSPRRDCSEQERYEELKHNYEIICDSKFLKKLDDIYFKMYIPPSQQKIKKRHKFGVIKICLVYAYEVYKRDGFAVFLRKITKFIMKFRRTMKIRYFCAVRTNWARKKCTN